MSKRKSTAPKAKAADTGKDPEVKIENALGKSEMFFEKNWKLLTTIGVAILVIAAGIYAYHGLVLAPRSKKASDAMYVAQQLFAAEDYATALSGDGNNLGFVDIVDNYRGTKQARLAAHYAGICYLREGDTDSALDYLARYKATKGVPNAILNAQNEGLKGDIHVQKGDYPAAVKAYGKAVNAADNVLTTPMYLKKMGLACEALNDYTAAVKAYRRISSDYATSLEARDIDKFAAAAEQKL